MGNEDKDFKELYTNMFDGINASEKLQEKVNDMALNKKSSKKVLKLVCAVGIAATLIVISCIGVYSSRGSREQYEDVVYNGKTVSARFATMIEDDTYVLGFLQDGYEYNITISGTYDKDKETVYINDEDDYAIASTEQGAKLNLYEAVEKAKDITLNEENGQAYLTVRPPYNPESYQTMDITNDNADGKKDGVITVDENIRESYIITSDGRLVQTIKRQASGPFAGFSFDYSWDLLWGYNDENYDGQ